VTDHTLDPIGNESDGPTGHFVGNQWVDKLVAAQSEASTLSAELNAAREQEILADGAMHETQASIVRLVVSLTEAQADTARIISELTAALAQTARLLADTTSAQGRAVTAKRILTDAQAETTRLLADMAAAHSEIARLVADLAIGQTRSARAIETMVKSKNTGHKDGFQPQRGE
jgi:chromosome segregation ATPase